MKTQVLTDDGLSVYDEIIKNYIKKQGIGVSLDDVKALIDASDKNTTYTLTKNENNEIVLIGSDGSETKIRNTSVVIQSTEPTTQVVGDIWYQEY